MNSTIRFIPMGSFNGVPVTIENVSRLNPAMSGFAGLNEFSVGGVIDTLFGGTKAGNATAGKTYSDAIAALVAGDVGSTQASAARKGAAGTALLFVGGGLALAALVGAGYFLLKK